MLYPKFYFKNVTEIQREFFSQNKIKTVLMDLDGTLAPADVSTTTPDVLQWIYARRCDGLKLIIISNNNRDRVKEFANKVGIPFFANANKPTQKLFRKIKKRELDNICIIGDQIFTDVLGGNAAGFTTVLVDPIESDKRPFKTSIMRFFERPFRTERR